MEERIFFVSGVLENKVYRANLLPFLDDDESLSALRRCCRATWKMAADLAFLLRVGWHRGFAPASVRLVEVDLSGRRPSAVPAVQREAEELVVRVPGGGLAAGQAQGFADLLRRP